MSSSQNASTVEKINSLRNSYLSNKNVTDSLIIAEANYKIGELYRYSYKVDSAYYYYYKAEKVFKKLNDKLKTAKTLYGIAVIQKDSKDLTGSELISIEAISLLDELEQNNEVRKYKSFLYNNLGLVFGELGMYNESISYYEEALKIKTSLDGDNTATVDNSINNVALLYKKSGKYDLALKKYQEILSNENLVNDRPDFYALVLDNFAHTKYLLNDKKDLPELYFQALKVTDKANPDGGYNSIIINQHLASYYSDMLNTDSAKYYAYRAKEIAENYSKDELLTSLLLLSKIEEGEEAAEHLKTYIKLNDSLQKAERKIRNKFARIRFETSQIEEENVRISRERFWLIVVSFILLIAALLIYVIISQRAKNKELVFERQQQEANEEIYNLMLGEHEKIEEARTLEKKRISEELHDGVLGRLFGTRLSLDSLNMNNTLQAVETRGQYIKELKVIEDDIRKVSHELNTDFVSGSGYIDIVKTLVETQTKLYKLQYSLNFDDDIHWDAISNKYKIHIYRMLQEVLHNIHKHANANHVNISTKLKNNVICMAITDNGSGFDVNKAKSGIGIKNMNSRIKALEGELNITSKKGTGTTVKIEIPITYPQS
ncbi:hypothetical protein MHTCC0001_20590 [Flavobacteriaceae bacterium MHTCC 0001]